MVTADLGETVRLTYCHGAVPLPMNDSAGYREGMMGKGGASHLIG